MKRFFYILVLVVILLLALTGCQKNNLTTQAQQAQATGNTKGITVDLANFSPRRSSIVMPRSLVEFNKERIPTDKEAILTVFSSNDTSDSWSTKVDYQIADINKAKVFLPDDKNAIVVINKEAVDRFYSKDNRDLTIAIVYLDENHDIQVSFVHGSISVPKSPENENKLVVFSSNGGQVMENHTRWDWFLERCSFRLYLKK